MEAAAPAARFSVDIPPEMMEGMTAGGLLDRRISRAEALQVTAVLRARNLICSTLATLPLDMVAPDKRVLRWALFEQPDPDLPRSVQLAYTLEDLLFEGVAWWQVIERTPTGWPRRARYVPVDSVHVGGAAGLPSENRLTPDQPFPRDGVVFIDGIPQRDIDVIRFDSPNPPLLVHAARAIRTCLKLDMAAARYADDPLPLGFFKPKEGAEPLSTAPGSANDGTDRSEVDLLLDQWEAARAKRAWGYVQGVDAEPMAWNPEQLQLAAQRQHAVLEIARAAGIDPEDLGVSTTSRTYQNSEHRRQDLTDFTLGAYVSALQDRLSMQDIAPPNHVARFRFSGFLRTTTPLRYQAYETGLRVGALTEDEIRELEDRPPLTPAQKARKDQLNGVAPVSVPAPAGNGGNDMSRDVPTSGADQSQPRLRLVESVNFSTATGSTVRVQFAADETEKFEVDTEGRTIIGLAVPWNKVAVSGFSKWRFRPGSLRWTDPARVKLNLHHDRRQLIGRATRLQNTSKGLKATFKIARGPDGDRALALAEDGVLDGMSIEVEFDDSAGDGWRPWGRDESVNEVFQGALAMVALTGAPAFEDARVQRVMAAKEEPAMGDENKPATGGAGTLQFDLDAHLKAISEATAKSHEQLTAELSKSIGDSITAGMKAALENLPAPQDGPQPVRAARFHVTREEPVYRFDGTGHSLVRDAWYAARERDDEAAERIRRYRVQQNEMAKLAGHYASTLQFAAQSTGTAPEIIPPGYRPDLYVPELIRGRPLVGLCSRGTISNATPFVVPKFVSSTNATADHVEGTNPTDGELEFGTETVTPGAISGKMVLTREIVDSSNPAIDQIALATMRESYNRQTEQKVYAALNGASNNTVPYAEATVITDVRGLLADYPFVRFAAPTGAAMNQKVTKTFATAVGTDGRPLLPSVGAENTSGLGNAVDQGWFIDGLRFIPAWAIGDSASDDVALIVNRADVWVWESPLLTFRFEEKQGPALIELALFGYFATHVLRPAGIFAVRNPEA